MNLTNLQGHIPDNIYNKLQEVADKYEINTVSRMSNFLGQCDHESDGFRQFTENLNYSSAAILQTFPTHFNGDEDAKNYNRNPEKIANRVYRNRMGNGDEASGDGWRHRGRGCIQITGKSNQQAFFESIGLPVDSDPELIATTYPLGSAAWFWDSKNLNKVVDLGGDAVVTNVTKIINGGTNGLSDRIRATAKYKSLLA